MVVPDVSEPIERWTAKRRVALVVSILKGETTTAEAARTRGLTIGEIEEWQEKFLQGAESALVPTRNSIRIGELLVTCDRRCPETVLANAENRPGRNV